MSEITMRDVEKLDFHTMPEDQGQIVHVSYAVSWEWGVLVCHTLDQSDREESYSWATIDPDGDSDFEPQNGVLPDTDGNWAKLPQPVMVDDDAQAE